MRASRLVLLITGIGLAGSLVAAVSVAGPKKDRFRVEGIPFELAANGPVPKVQRGGDGRLHFEQKVKLKIDGETAEKPVVVKASHADSAGGGHLHLSVTEETGGKTSQFAYTPANNTIALAAENDSVTITKNPDGSYTVAGQKAANGKEAAALLRANGAYKAIPRENLLVAYAAAQAPLPEVKAPIGDYNGLTRAASGPAVCTTFKDVCDCIACDVAAKGAACARCK